MEQDQREGQNPNLDLYTLNIDNLNLGKKLCQMYTFHNFMVNTVLDENFERGVHFENFQQDMDIPFLNNLKRYLSVKLPIFPSLSMFSFTNSIFLHATSDCPCRTMSTNSYSLSIKQHSENRNFISGVFLPFSPKIKIHTCTFLWNSLVSGVLHCPEIGSFFNNGSELPIDIRDYIKQSLINNNAKTSCMILLGTRKDFSIFTKFITSLTNWFPDSRITIWGGIVSEIAACIRNNNIRLGQYCRIRTILTCFFINIETLEAWSFIWPIKNQTEEMFKQELINFKQGIHLKNYSLGFIFFGSQRNASDVYEYSKFQEVFPEIQAFCLHSALAIGGEVLQDIGNNFYKWKLLGQHGPITPTNEETAIMIITYE